MCVAMAEKDDPEPPFQRTSYAISGEPPVDVGAVHEIEIAVFDWLTSVGIEG